MEKTVSIIIPSYKYAHYLAECISSVRGQTYPLHEIIVVSDGSPDNTVEVCKELGVRCIEKENGGLASARNVGITEATGEYIMCLDADDKLTPGAIEEHVRLMVDEKTIAQCALMEFGDRYVVMIPTKPTGLERILKSNTIFCNAMFTKKMWEQVGGYDESEIMRLGREDHEFWVRLMAEGCEVNSSDFIALRYRVHEGQMTQATLYPNMAKIDEYFYKKFRDLYDRFGITLNK